MFKYFYLPELKQVCKEYAHLLSDTDVLSDVLGNLISCSIKKDEELDNLQLVSLPRFLSSDIELLHENITDEYLFNWLDINNEINQIRQKYGHEFVDMIITDDNDAIIKSINDVIIFLMDKVFKIDKVQIAFEFGKTLFETNDNKIELESNYPSIIYSALQQNFIIKEHREVLNIKIITIEKRSEDNNVNYAN